MRDYIRKKERRSDSRTDDRESSFKPRREGFRSSGFGGRSSGFSSGGFRPRESRPFRSRDSDGFRGPIEETTVLCDKCGKSCTVPFKPSGDKPVYCSDCFRKDSGPRRDGPRQPRAETVDLSEINRKLDKIMQALEIK